VTHWDRPIRWPDYYQAIGHRAPREPLLDALQRFGSSVGFAVDLGCGNGVDTVELLRRGWRVLAIDAEADGIERLLQRDDLVNRDKLETCVARLEDATWPTANLVNASLILPFVPPTAFDEVWYRIVQSLATDSRFAGHFFGNRDTWAELQTRTHHSRDQVQDLLKDFELERFDEQEYDGKTALGDAKHWHIFEVVARRR